MGFIETASGNSVWRGMDYAEPQVAKDFLKQAQEWEHEEEERRRQRDEELRNYVNLFYRAVFPYHGSFEGIRFWIHGQMSQECRA